MIYITGDMHGSLRGERVFPFKEGNRPEFMETITPEDALIVLGDFGYTWNKQLLNTYKYSFPTFTVDGNHDNFTILNNCPTATMLGGEVGVIKDNVYRLKTGEVYDFNGIKMFVFGGALSIDKSMRTPYKSWWPEEIPTRDDYKRALENLEKANWDIDIFLAHTCPEDVCEEMFKYTYKVTDPTEKMLSELEFEIKSHNPNANYKFFFGHHHTFRLSEKYICLYSEIMSLEKTSEGIITQVVES